LATERAVLLVDHGSRRAEANAQLDELVTLVQVRLPDRFVTGAHLELAAPSVPDGITRCLAAGAREILIHPFFLTPGRHASKDLPRLAQEAAERHARVSIRLGPPLGLHPRVVDAVLERILALPRAAPTERPA
jgi:sirohydrochlorin ferrochelatase